MCACASLEDVANPRVDSLVIRSRGGGVESIRPTARDSDEREASWGQAHGEGDREGEGEGDAIGQVFGAPRCFVSFCTCLSALCIDVRKRIGG